MKSHLFSRNRILAILLASIVVILFTSGAFAQGTASLMSLFTKDTAAVTSVPGGEQPTSPRQ